MCIIKNCINLPYILSAYNILQIIRYEMYIRICYDLYYDLRNSIS